MKIAVLVRGSPRTNGLKRFAYDLEEVDSRYRVYELGNILPRESISRLSRFLIEPFTNSKKVHAIDADAYLAVSSVEALPALLGKRRPLGVMCFEMSNWLAWQAQTVARRAWRLLLRGYDDFSYNNSTVVFCPTDLVKEQLEHIYYKIEPVVVSPGLSKSFLRNAGLVNRRSNIRTNSNRQDFNLLMIPGDFSGEKGIPSIIQGINQFRRRKNQYSITLRIIGSGTQTQRDQLSVLARRSMIDIQFLEKVSDSQLLDLYSSSDALIESTVFDWFNYPPLEAMACGTIVVYATTLPTIGFFKGIAFRATLFNPTSIAWALEKSLLDTSLRSARINKGIELANKVTMQETADSIYRRLCG